LEAVEEMLSIQTQRMGFLAGQAVGELHQHLIENQTEEQEHRGKVMLAAVALGHLVQIIMAVAAVAVSHQLDSPVITVR
tara:strand:- start:177 stop:413 length:237 start_codon:yes stop_codon:yes gene_type:complete